MDTTTSSPQAEKLPGERKSFARRFFERSGKLADKWEHYLSVYDVELSAYLDKAAPVRLLEIGVQNGGSLELWSEFLPPGSQVWGVDCDQKVGALRFENPNVTVVVQDGTDAEAMRPVLGDAVFDVIVDDGSHICRDVIVAFQLYFDYLAPGGKFVIEDLHTSYFRSHGGGYRDPASSIEWLKALVDVLNYDHIQPHEPLSEQERFAMQRLNAQVGRVSFYDSMAVIEKLPVEKVRPYRRVWGGTETEVVPPEDWLFKFPTTTLEPILFAHPAARRVETALLRELSRRQAVIDGLRAEQQEAEREHEAERAAAAAREAALAAEIDTLRLALAGLSPADASIDETAELSARVLAVAEA